MAGNIGSGSMAERSLWVEGWEDDEDEEEWSGLPSWAHGTDAGGGRGGRGRGRGRGLGGYAPSGLGGDNGAGDPDDDFWDSIWTGFDDSDSESGDGDSDEEEGY